MKISIIGNGAVGNMLAVSCHQQKLNYHVLTRSGLTTELKVTDGFKQQWKLTLPVTTLSTLSQSKLIILPLKAYQIVDFIEQNSRLFHAKQTLVLLHNGMGTIETCQQLLPNNNVIAGITNYGAFKPDTSTLLIKGQGESHFGWITQQIDCDHQAIEQVLSGLLPPSTWHTDIRLALWLKLAVNACINPLTALYNVTNGELRASHFQTQLMALCEEISHIMTYLGFVQAPETLLQRVNKVIIDTADNFSSMNRDVAAKRPTEIDFINGYVVEQAHRFGLPCPVNLNLLEQIRALETHYLPR